MKLLIADSGSTKTDWILLDDKSKSVEFQTKGINPYVHSLYEIRSVIKDLDLQLDRNVKGTDMYFYGAGCSTKNNKEKVADALKILDFNSVAIEHDLLAVCRALFGGDKGVACILGTGSSSALYEDHQIIEHIPSMGYVMGDEGGGVDFGKRLLNGIYKGLLDKKVISLFMETYKLSASQALDKIYFQDSANRFFASFAPFVKDNIDNEGIRSIVRESFSNFIEWNVLNYPNSKRLPIGFSGSIAYYFQDELKEVLAKYNLTIGPVLKSPIEGLIKYHREFST